MLKTPKGFTPRKVLRAKHSQKYSQISESYDRLGKILRQDLLKLLEDNDIDVLDVNYRLKDFNSFIDKIKLKGYYVTPFEKINDLCGLRIICYYISDLERIDSLIQNEFNVIKIKDKSEERKENEFGYDSIHYIITLKNNWLTVPNYRGLGDLKAEIQVRTVLMHAWANTSHKLAYKKKEQAPTEFLDRLFQLNAILNNADSQFNSLKEDKDKYIEGMTENGQFNLERELNLDSLQTFLDFYLPDRESSIDSTTYLLDEILDYNDLHTTKISLKTVFEAYEKYKDELKADETKEYGWFSSDDFDNDSFEIIETPFLAQTGFIFAVLRKGYENF